MEKITYTFPADFRVAALAGQTVTGGVPSFVFRDRKTVLVVEFATLVDGKKVTARLDDKPDLQALVDAYNAQQEIMAVNLIAQRAALAESLSWSISAEYEAHSRAVEHMSEHGFAPKSKKDYPALTAEATKALADFDLAHPEVLAKIKAANLSAAASITWYQH